MTDRRGHDLATLADVQAISILKARYFRFVDTKAWPKLRALFTDQATLHFPERTTDPEHVDTAISRISRILDGAVTAHSGFMPEIILTASDRASGIWAMEDRIQFPKDRPSPFGATRFLGRGHYHDTYVKVNNDWLIDTLRLERLFVTPEPEQT